MMWALLLTVALGPIQEARKCDTKFARPAKYCGACDKILPSTARRCGACDAKTTFSRVCEKMGFRCGDCGAIYKEEGTCSSGHAETTRVKLLDASRMVYACPDTFCSIIENKPGNCTNATCERNGQPLQRSCSKSGTAPHLPGYPGPRSRAERAEAARREAIKAARNDPMGFIRAELAKSIAFYTEKKDWETVQVIYAVAQAAKLELPDCAEKAPELARRISEAETLRRGNLPTLMQCAADCADVYDSMKENKTREEELARRMIRSIPEYVRALRMLNDARLGLKQKPVWMDAATSVDCMLHAHYTSKTGDLGHSEEKDSPHTTKAGARAAARSNVSTGDIVVGMRGWLNSFYHRLPLINPGLRGIGMGSVTIKDGPGSNSLAEIRTHSRSVSAEMVYPYTGQTGIPLTFSNEIPDPLPEGVGYSGPPVTVTLKRGAKPKNVTARLENLATGASTAEFFLSTPDRPANKAFSNNMNTICAIPKKALEAATKYRVTITAELSSKRRTWTTEFTTRE